MKGVAKKILFAVMPGLAQSLQWERQRRHIQRFEASLGLPGIVRKFVAQYGWKVIGGPFEGMEYIEEATGSMLLPKLIGSYEAELAPAMEYLLSQQYDVIADIGCAEGYYAIGLAWRMPSAQVFAFDINPDAKRFCSELARRNGVENRVTVSGAADFATLNRILQGRTLTVCDCEGCEAFLLDPEQVGAFAAGDLLVELHDHSDGAISPTLLRRFSGTHDIQIFQSVERDPADWPAVGFLSAEEGKVALGERRPPQRWFLMTPRKGIAPAHA